MGIRINKRIRVAPGVYINLGRTGGSLSLGRPGSMINIGTQGTRTTVGLPGSGISYVTQKSWKSYAKDAGLEAGTGRKSGSGRREMPRGEGEVELQGGQRRNARQIEAVSPSGWVNLPRDEYLELNFIERLTLSASEEALVDGCRELLAERENSALDFFERAASLADGAFMAGATALRLKRYDQAVSYLTSAAQRRGQLGRSFARHGFQPQLLVPVTEEVAAVVGADLRGVLLALSEAYQLLWRWDLALEAVARLRKQEPGDPVLLLAQVELMLTARGEGKTQLERLLGLLSEVENVSPVHSALLLYRARAQRALGLTSAARDTLSAALRKKADRPTELLNALRYERAEIYAELGNSKKALEDFEAIYAIDPEFMDVAERRATANSPTVQARPQ